MFYRDLTLYRDAFKGFEGDVWDLREEIKKVWGGDVSAEEYEGDDAHLDNITLYDYPLYGPSNELLAFCRQYGLDLYEQWGEQLKFDKLAKEAVMSVW